MKKNYLSLVGASALMMCASAQAELVAYDGFWDFEGGATYGDKVHGHHTGYGWSGSWQATDAANKWYFRPVDATYNGKYTNLSTAGGCLVAQEGKTLQRKFPRQAWDGTSLTNTVWLSFVHYKKAYDHYSTLSFYDGAETKIECTANQNSTYASSRKWSFEVSEQKIVTQKSCDKTKDLVVLRIDFSEATTDVYAWVGTGLGITNELQTSTADAKLLNAVPFGIDTVRMYSKAQDTKQAYWDELRIGTTFKDVTQSAPTRIRNRPIVKLDMESKIATLAANIEAGAGCETDVYAYWGSVDGGNVSNAWENVAYVGQATTNGLYTFEIPVLEDALYMYRFYATNSYGESWATTAEPLSTKSITIAPLKFEGSESVDDYVTFRVMRPNDAVGVELDINIELNGTAINGVDYEDVAQPLIVTMPAAATTVDFAIEPNPDTLVEDDETVIATLLHGAYVIGAQQSATGIIKNVVLPTEATNIWIGAGNASNPDNWSLGHSPTSDETVMIDSFSHGSMNWDAGVNGLTDTVAEWIQTQRYQGTVSFPITYTTSEAATDFTAFTITGNCTLNGGTWVHAKNHGLTEDRYWLNVYIHGDMIINTNASINVADCGRGITPGQAAGSDEAKKRAICGWGSKEDKSGASYGGSCGSDVEYSQYAKSYGSIFEPIFQGSGTTKDSSKTTCRGAGAIKLTVDGACILNGNIFAKGSDAANAGGGSSGGSIYLTAKSLTGQGQISTTGGFDGTHGSGSGGRIALYLTGAGETLESFGIQNVSAYGRGDQYKKRFSAAGTVYYQTASDGDASGILRICNIYDGVDNNYTKNANPYTSIPADKKPSPAENLANVKLEVINYGMVNLTADQKMHSVTLKDEKAKLLLKGKKLTVKEFTDKDGKVFKTPGLYTGNDTKAFDNVTFSDGVIEILSGGGFLILR